MAKLRPLPELSRTLKWTRNKMEWEPENKEEIIKLKLKIASKEKDYKKTFKRPDKENFIVKTEIANFTHTHCSDKLQRPELYKQNFIWRKIQKFVVSLIRWLWAKYDNYCKLTQ